MLKYISIVVLILTLMCCAGMSVEPKSAAVGTGAIWSPDPKIIDKMREECWNVNPFLLIPQKAAQCCIDIMKGVGAPPEAVAFSSAMLKNRTDTFCYMSSFRKISIVDMANIVCPFKDDSTSDMVLLNGQPAIVWINDLNNLNKIDLFSEPEYGKMLRRHNEALLWPFTSGLTGVKKLPGGGERYMFNFRLLNGCEGCPLSGTMTVAYDFSADGHFMGVTLIELVTAE